MESAVKNGLIILMLSFFLVDGCSIDSGKQPNGSAVDSAASMIGLSHNQKIDSLLFYEGERIFKSDCNKCHLGKEWTDNHLDDLVGWVGPAYLKLYITRQDSLVAARDSIALTLKRVWGNQPNSHNFAYSDQQLSAIVKYLK